MDMEYSQQFILNFSPLQFNLMACCAASDEPKEQTPIYQIPFTDRGNPEPSKIQRIVEDIVKACKGLGTDEKKLISVTGECTGIERDAVSELYTKTYNKTLHGLFKSELSGKFEKMFLAMYTTRYVFWAEQIKEAVKGAGTDEKKLIDLLVSTGSEYAEVDRVFTQLYKKCIYETLSSECGNSCWGKLMKAWITNKRVAGNAQTIAEKLHKAAKGAGTDEKTFIELLTTTDQQTYQQVDQEFSRAYKKELRQVIKAEFSGKAEYAFLAVHDYLIEPARFVASMLKQAVKGCGTNDDKLIYTTALHAQNFAGTVQQAYESMGLGNLKKDLKSDLTGKQESPHYVVAAVSVFYFSNIFLLQFLQLKQLLFNVV
uniref:Annexin 17 n=1 Tax=Spironucleus vortens TaxID=58336 RepID=A0A142C685_SPIVO|nr:annexin 17 [Spironucleus vortens]